MERRKKPAKVGIKYNLMKEKSTVSTMFKRSNKRHTHVCILLCIIYQMRWWRAPKSNENQTNN